MEMVYFIIIFIAIGAILYLYVLGMIILHLSSMLFGAPYVPSREDNIERVMELFSEGYCVADLGSGDGRVLIELVKKFRYAHGYEINPVILRKSRKNIQAHDLEKRVKIRGGSFFQKDLSSYDAIYIYGISYIMKRLEKKLQKELKSGAQVVTCGFHFPHWEPKKKNGSVWLYIKE